MLQNATNETNSTVELGYIYSRDNLGNDRVYFILQVVLNVIA